jgi:hypothetical protein
MAMAPGLVHHDRSAEVMRKSDALDLEQHALTGRYPKHIARSLKRSAERSTRRKAGAYRSDVHVDLLHQSRRGNLPAPRKKILARAKSELRRLFGRDQPDSGTRKRTAR